jgi:hypothetical protein
MESRNQRQRSLIIAGLALGLALAACTRSARANVYATNIKLNGELINATAAQGSDVSISYILNEPASAGVTINVLSNAVVVRTIDIAGDTDGAFTGLNTVTWDGKDADGSNVGPGAHYSVRITAASAGYDVWTTTSTDGLDGNYVWEGRGIGVNQNPKSPYYGRIFVANSHIDDVYGINVPGDNVGMIKLNADGSFADEGTFSTGGHVWAGDFYSPWKLEVSADDYVYINDWTSSGEIYRWDQTLSTNSQLHVLGTNNWAPGCNMSGPAIFGTGTNTEIYMADIPYPGSRGIVKYTVTADGTCAANDIGTVVIPISHPLSLYPYDIALDKHHNYYIIQYGADTNDAAPRVMRYPANYDINTNAVADWDTATLYGAAQQADDWNDAFGIAVDPTGTYVAVCFDGTADRGNTKILEAATGILVTNLDLDMDINSAGATHDDLDVCWDAVGNVYYIDDYSGVWRTVSPPGTNSSTTEAVVTLEVVDLTPAPAITNYSLAAGVFTMSFTAGASDTASAFEVLSCGTVNGTYGVASGANITESGGTFQATVPASAPVQFYRIHRK